MIVRKLLQALERSRREAPQTLGPGPVLIYGAGNRGRQVATFLRDCGHNVIGLADAAASGAESWQSLPIRSLAAWQAQGATADWTLVVAIHNHRVDLAQLLDHLAQIGFGRIVNPVEFQAIFQGQFADSYWLAGPRAYAGHDGELAALAPLFAGNSSRDLLQRIVEFRLTGNYAVLPAPTPEEQYCPADLPRWTEPLRFVDAGAFDGDTLRQLRRCGYGFEQIAAFEPDPENFARLSQCVADLGGGICIPCGLAQTCRQARFSQDGTGSSRISADGGQVIQCVSLDEALPGFHPTLIKMDIEGAEPEALQGAVRTISACRPALAISVYHHPAHLWQIPLLIDSWQLDYRFHLRMHGHSSFDLVLYALPQTRD
jgi:FkbM family methyltransferase